MRRIIEHIEGMKERPDHEKKRFALFASGVATALIFVVWLSVLFPRGVSRELAKNRPSEPETPSELAQAVDSLKAQAGEVRDQWNDFKESQAAAVATWNASTSAATSTIPTY